MNIFEILNKGGPVVWILFVYSIIALAWKKHITTRKKQVEFEGLQQSRKVPNLTPLITYYWTFSC